jgi:hypothetical protein
MSVNLNSGKPQQASLLYDGLPRPIPTLQPHQQRVVAEKTELDARCEKLAAFINGAIFQTMPEAERTRLERQHTLMTELSAILGERIAAF